MARWYDEVYRDQMRYGLKSTARLYDQRSDHQRVEVIDTVTMGRTLVIDGVFMTSTADEHYYHEMLVHPALTTCERSARVLIIGGGDGGTAKRVLEHAQVQSVLMVEIDGCVIEACKEFLPELGAWNDPRLELVIGDGIAYARDAAPKSFDLVILDGTDPMGPGEGLFNREFYRSIEQLLGPGGVFVLQSESPFLTRPLFLEVQATLAEVFNKVQPYFGPAPLYAAGTWSWTYATHTSDWLAIDQARAAAIEAGCKYYNREIHRAAFVLPNELRALLPQAVSPLSG